MVCALWSFVPDSAKAIVESKISDYKKIDGWSVEMNNQKHAEDVAWLASEFQSLSNAAKRDSQNQDGGRNILVVTHHAPSLHGTSAPEHASNPWTSAFATDLLPQLGTDKVKTWIFGHTHYTTELNLYGVQLIANQRGYVLPGREFEPVQDTIEWPRTFEQDSHNFHPEKK